MVTQVSKSRNQISMAVLTGSPSINSSRFESELIMIAEDDPFFGGELVGGTAVGALKDSSTPAFIAEVIRLVNKSPSLLQKISDFKASSYALEVVPPVPGEGGHWDKRTGIITAQQQSVDRSALYGSFSPAGQMISVSDAARFVGTLAHELGHSRDPSNNYQTGYYSTTDELASIFSGVVGEGKAAFSNGQTYDEIFRSSKDPNTNPD